MTIGRIVQYAVMILAPAYMAYAFIFYPKLNQEAALRRLPRTPPWAVRICGVACLCIAVFAAVYVFGQLKP